MCFVIVKPCQDMSFLQVIHKRATPETHSFKVDLNAPSLYMVTAEADQPDGKKNCGADLPLHT